MTADGHHAARESGSGVPTVSVIMANYRGAAYISEALQSVQAQTVRSLEIIVSDDASPDASVEIVRTLMAEDDRIRLVVAERNGGPGGARNSALEVARGEWIAIVDSDDMIVPDRLGRLIAAAAESNADGVADDLIFFGDDEHAPRTLLGDGPPRSPASLSIEDFVRSDTPGSGLPPLGYLKPLLRRSRLANLRYDPGLRIGEDYDLLLRFLAGGNRLVLVPEPLYRYRRSSGSISHRLSEGAVVAMMECQAAFERAYGPFGSELRSLLAERMTALRRIAAFERLVAAIKQRRLASASLMMMREPPLVPLLARSLLEHVSRRFRRLPMARAVLPSQAGTRT